MKSLIRYTTTVIVGLLLAGCAVVQMGTTEVKWEKGTGEDRVFNAMHSGAYALCAGNDYKPQFQVKLKQGDTLGFKKGPAGKVIAVYGDKSSTFDDGKYYWNYRGKGE